MAFLGYEQSLTVENETQTKKLASPLPDIEAIVDHASFSHSV